MSAALALTGGCAPQTELLPPLGEALVMVDTDAPVPRLAARLRIDVYAEDGSWLDSREQPLLRREDWPGSFSVFIDEGVPERGVRLRLRAYADGKERDYRGERFEARPDGVAATLIIEPPPGDGLPRLIRDGVDVTPATEPLPALTIDRLLSVRLRDGVRGSVRVLLSTACIGTMADLAGGTSCVDSENVRAPLGDAPLDEDTSVAASIGVGPLAAEEPCHAAPRAPDASLATGEVCVPGGAFILGSPAIVEATAAEETAQGDNPLRFNAVPERVAILEPFLLDRHEVTVARWRAVEAAGFVSPDATPYANDGPFPPSYTAATGFDDMCTWSTTPLGREKYPLTCVSWAAARAFCQHEGGDLPTEAEWEYAAAAAGRDADTLYPWGAAEPTCAMAVFARFDHPDPQVQVADCIRLGYGPAPVDAPGPGDVTPLGVVGMGGNLAEWVRDDYRSYASACWLAQPLSEPLCWDPAAAYRSYRGANWVDHSLRLRAATRRGNPVSMVSYHTGIRCMRPGAP